MGLIVYIYICCFSKISYIYAFTLTISAHIIVMMVQLCANMTICATLQIYKENKCVMFSVCAP